jgi:MFS family permease
LEDSGYAKLGFFELAMFYAMYGIGSLFATPVMRRFGPQKCMILGSILDCVWILTSLVPVMKMKHDKDPEASNHPEPFYFSDFFVYFIVLFTSVLGGLGESMQWVAQGKYIADCATEKTKGFFFGYFWTYFMASQIFGSILSAVVFEYYSLTTFYITMGAFALLSGFIFHILKDPIENPLFTEPEASTALGESESGYSSDNSY